MVSNIPVDRQTLEQIERQALLLFLESVRKEFNTSFSTYSATVDNSANLPQLSVRAK